MIDVGEKIILKAEYKLEGVLTNPSTPVTVVVIDPAQTRTQSTASSSVDGVFQVEFTPSVSGSHYYTFFSNDDAIAQGQFVAQAVFAK